MKFDSLRQDMKKMEGHVFRMYDTNGDGTFFLIIFSVNGYLPLIFYLISVILRSRCNQHGRISSRFSCPVKWNSRRELAGSLMVIIMMILVGLQNQMLIIMLTILNIIGTKLDEHVMILPIFTEDLQNL